MLGAISNLNLLAEADVVCGEQNRICMAAVEMWQLTDLLCSVTIPHDLAYICVERPTGQQGQGQGAGAAHIRIYFSGRNR